MEDSLHTLATYQQAPHQHVQPLQVEDQAYQAPFSRRCHQATQRELAEAQDLLDDADDRLDRRLPQAVDRLTDLRLQLVGHLDSRGNEMAGLEALQSVQYATVRGERFAIINVDDWEALIEWLETLEDIQIGKQAFAELKASGGDRERAGWLRWDHVKEELV